MPKRKNLDLAGEMGEDIDVTEEEAMDAAQIVAVAPPVVAAIPVAPISLTFEQLQTLLASAHGKQDQSGLVEALADSIARSREPIPENKFSPDVSVFNPLGERDHPRPGLKCEMFLGTQDAKTKQVNRTYPFLSGDVTAVEQIALNTLHAIEPTNIELLDGSAIKVSVYAELDPVSDALRRLTMVVPQSVMQKGSQIKNMLPPITNIVEQLTGHNFAKLSKDDLAWFLAEHRAKRYVAVRDAVAA